MSWILCEFSGSEASGELRERRTRNAVELFYPCEGVSSSTCSSLKITLSPGIYNVTLYGAKGGDTPAGSHGGNGGMASGILEQKKTQTFYLNIGGRGQDQTSQGTSLLGGYNGGGNSNYGRGSGGGSTDLMDYQNQKIMIAAGGGGAHSNAAGCTPQNGGAGGGLEGEIGGNAGYNIPCHGTQSGCVGGNGVNWEGTPGAGCSNENAGAGGSGYWGGGSAGCAGSSGGSSFINNLFSHPTYLTGANNGYGFARFECLFMKSDRYMPINPSHLFFTLFIFFKNKA